MKHQKLNITLLALLIFPFFNATAQLTGHVNYAQIGIEFDIPDGWFGQEMNEMVVLGSNVTPGVIIISTHENTKAQLEAEAKNPIVDNAGTNLRLSGDLEELSANAVGGEFTGTMEYQPAKAYIIGIANPHGGYGVNIVAASTNNAYAAEHEKAARQLFKSFKFKKPAASTTAASSSSNSSNSSELQEWIDWFQDVRLVYLYYYGSGGSGDSDEIRIDLCSRGYFNYTRNGYTVFSGDGYSAYNSGNGEGQGTWNVLQNGSSFVLQLKYHSGEVSTYKLEYKDKKLYLDGTRYYRIKSGDEAPNCR